MLDKKRIDLELEAYMKIMIPALNENKNYIEDKSSIVLIGANGSGKTRMSVWIDENNSELNIHRISAQKSLNLPKMVSPTEIKIAEEEFLYGLTNEDKEWLIRFGKNSGRWGNEPETYLLNDYYKLMQYLMTENYEKSIEYREKHKEGDSTFDNYTRLEKIKEIWEDCILHRRLKVSAGKIETSNKTSGNYYNGSEMSDGERAIFYFIGEVLCAKENSLIIVDEPENHLHKSILVRLWDAIEASREDCVFLYVTHNLDFASSRMNSQIIWVKEFFGDNKWDYYLVDDLDTIDSLKLEIMGNRQKVLLVEGTRATSIDRKLYSKIYPEYNVISMEGCNTVIQTTKAYNNTDSLHYVEVKGIVDRDCRSQEEINSLNNDNIFVPMVSEVENLFLLTEVIEIVAKELAISDVDETISSIKENVFQFLNVNKEKQALLFARQKIQNNIIQRMNKTAFSIDEYKSNLKQLFSIEDVDFFYNEEINRIDNILKRKNYSEALKIINDKALLSASKVPMIFGWKKDSYINYVLRLLDKNDDCSRNLKRLFREYISNKL